MTGSRGAQIELARLASREFDTIRNLVYTRFGIDLAGKQALVAGRLSRLLRKSGVSSYADYLSLVCADASGESLVELIDVLTTNYTSFFREPQHFAFLRSSIFPSLAQVPHVRIWSAACSSGQEPYSIAFLLSDMLGSAARARASILATDISRRALQQAVDGAYPTARLQEIPADRRGRYFIGGSASTVRVHPGIRSMIAFERLNLMEDFTRLGSFHVIFCRNVMIYFDWATQQRLVERLASRLHPGGYLLIGHAETLNGFDHPLEYLQPSTYRKPVQRTVEPSVGQK